MRTVTGSGALELVRVADGLIRVGRALGLGRFDLKDLVIRGLCAAARRYAERRGGRQKHNAKTILNEVRQHK
jgi:hypothetical protein